MPIQYQDNRMPTTGATTTTTGTGLRRRTISDGSGNKAQLTGMSYKLGDMGAGQTSIVLGRR